MGCARTVPVVEDEPIEDPAQSGSPCCDALGRVGFGDVDDEAEREARRLLSVLPVAAVTGYAATGIGASSSSSAQSKRCTRRFTSRRRGVGWTAHQPTRRRQMVLATAKIEDFDRFWNTFSTKGAEKRKQYGSGGAQVFAIPTMPTGSGWSSTGTRRAGKTSPPTPMSLGSFRKPGLRKVRPRPRSSSASTTPSTRSRALAPTKGRPTGPPFTSALEPGSGGDGHRDRSEEQVQRRMQTLGNPNGYCGLGGTGVSCPDRRRDSVLARPASRSRPPSRPCRARPSGARRRRFAGRSRPG